MRRAVVVLVSALGLAMVAPAFGAGGPQGAADQDAAGLCRAEAGVPDAGVPVSAEDQAQRKAALAAAAEACSAAAEAPDAAPDILFHAAAVAQARRDFARAFALYQRAAEAGLGAAATRLGDFYTFGAAPGGEDVARAAEAYGRAAELGDPAGMTTLALLHRIGRGVAQDAGEMVRLLTAAAEAGYGFAQVRLAEVYLSGEGIPGGRDAGLGIPDPARAAALYEAAARGGNLEAAETLARLYDDPRAGLPDDPEAVVRLTRMRARTGDPAAIAAMAGFYEAGRGVTRDAKIAAGLYVKALEGGLSFDALRARAPARWDRETAMEFQKILQARGLYRGPIDGIIGYGSATAARALAPKP